MASGDPRTQAEAREYEEAYKAAKIQPVSLTGVELETVRRMLTQIPARHYLAGASATGDPPILLFPLPTTVPREKLSPDGLLFWLWGWPGYFGASLTFKVFFAGLGDPGCRVCVFRASPVIESLRGGLFRAVFARENRIRASFEVDFSPTPDSLSKYLEHWNNVVNHGPAVEDNDAHYWEVLGRSQLTSPQDRIAAGWVKMYRLQVSDLMYTVEKARSVQPLADPLPEELPSQIADLLGLVRDSDSITRLNEHFAARFASRSR